MDKIVCPISMASTAIKQCHPGCMLLTADGACMLALFLETQLTNQQ